MCFRAGALVILARHHHGPFRQLLHQPGKERKAGGPLAGLGRELHCALVSQPRGHVTEVRPSVQAQMASRARKAAHARCCTCVKGRIGALAVAPPRVAGLGTATPT